MVPVLVVLAVLAVLSASGEVRVPVVSAVGLGVGGAVLILEGATRRCLLYRLLASIAARSSDRDGRLLDHFSTDDRLHV
ncbi:YgaP-like transmembrane domain [Halorubrum sp. HHNYT27]|uniref:YgaP-like transmembrane domain n=1 Tax=Halorubrum sp. HHNYT27 TaxID=3402275 RepID=UPI003EBC5E24